MNDNRLESLFLKSNSLYIVQDIDNLLSIPSIQAALEKNYVLYFCHDVMELRYIFELYRCSAYDKPLLLVISLEYNSVPYDILKSSLQVSVSWRLLFPFLNVKALKKFSAEKLAQLLIHSSMLPQSSLSYNDTMLYLFNILYGIKFKYDQLNENTLLELAAKYYQIHDNFPSVFIEFIKKEVPSNLWIIFQSKEMFQSVLNKRFSQYILNFELLGYEKSSTPFNATIDFYLQAHIAYLLYPIPVNDITIFPESFRSLLLENGRLSPTISIVEVEKMSFNKFTMKDWKDFASLIGKSRSSYLIHEIEFEKNDILIQANQFFETWLTQSFESLRSLSSFPSPKLSHQVPHYLASSPSHKKALIVMDGMSFTFWEIIKPFLQKENWDIEEHAIFSWVPTLTTISRQAIFSGLEPRYFANTIHTTNRESALWKDFWINDGYKQEEISYQRALGLEDYNKGNISGFSSPLISIYGGVIDVIDQFMHNALQGLTSLHQEMKYWLDKKFLVSLLNDLHDAGYEIYLTSDHGHIESLGTGKINEGVLSYSKGQRVRMYDSVVLRNHTHAKFINTIEWNSNGLPESIHPLLAKGADAFLQKNQKIVTHGGINIEEVIVPFIQLKRNL